MSSQAAQNRLTEAAFALMTETGAHGVTSRAVGDLSGVKASGINYHFGGSDGLLSSTFALAHARATAWRERWALSLAAEPPAGAFANWFMVALEDYAYSEVAVRSVLRELSLDVARSSLRQSLARMECDAAEAFWGQVLGAFGLDEDRAGLAADFADGMATLHNHRPAGPEQLAWFAETCSRFCSRLAGLSVPAGWDGWRQAIRNRTLPPAADPRGADLLPGAVSIVGRQGLGGLTHRAVAKEAGVSLAAVTGPFPTRAALVRGAFEALLADLLRQPSLDTLMSGSVSPDAVARGFAASTFTPDGAPEPTMLAIVELLGAAGRDAQLREGLLAARVTRGETTWRLLSAMPGSETVDRLDAHILSTMSFGAIRAAFAQDRSMRRTELERRSRSQYLWLTGRPD